MPRKISQRSKKVSKKKLSKRLRTMKRNSKRMSRKSLRGGSADVESPENLSKVVRAAVAWDILVNACYTLNKYI